MSPVISHQDLASRALPMNAILLAQQSVLLPLYFYVPLWIALLNFIAAGLVFYAQKNPRFVIVKAVKLLITLVAVAGVFMVFKKFSGREAGVALITAMYGLKILETGKTRDANLLLHMGFFMLVAGFLFSQKPLIALYQFVPILFILNALVQMHSVNQTQIMGSSSIGVLKKLSRYLLIALPVMVIFFLFFPRLGGPIGRVPGGSSSMSGVSDSMGPGDISHLQLSDEIAFRVKFDNNSIPNQSDLYWRVLTLDKFDGFTWTRSKHAPASLPEIVDRDSQLYNYSINLEATSGHYLPTLEHSIEVPQNSRYLSDYTAYANYKVVDRIRYAASAALGLQLGKKLTESELFEYTALPIEGNVKSRLWATNKRKLALSDQDFINKILIEINQQAYFYTLQPPLMDEDTIDSFWLDHRKGFCEHYAGALVYLARAAGIPARVVIGYQGAEKNILTDYWIVRYANAHAWTEIWFVDQGWVRVDPTSAIAPSRVDQVLLQEYQQRESLFDQFDVIELDDIGMLKRFSYWLDRADNNWNEWILDFNSQRQRQLLSNWGLPNITQQQMIFLMVAVIVLFVLIMGYRWRNVRLAEAPLAAAYSRMLNQLAKRGVIPLDETLGPVALLKLLQQQQDPQLVAYVKVIKRYISVRYQYTQTNEQRVKSLLKAFKRLK